MTDLEERLRAAMESAVASKQPPGNLIELVRRRHRRHVRRAAVAGAASAAVVAVLIPAAAGVSGRGPGPAGGHRPPAPAVYVALQERFASMLVPISTATNRPGKPIRLARSGGSLAVTPDGKTLYVSAAAETIPISTATNKPGTPIRVNGGYFAIDPDGKTGYAVAPSVRPQASSGSRSPRSTWPPTRPASRSACAPTPT